MSDPDFTPLQPKAVLGIAAHPDDLDFGAAGTMAKFRSAGAAIHYLILTDGGKGSADRQITSEELVKIRQAEQRTALEALGGGEAHFLNHPDGGLEITMDLKREIVELIRQIKPDVVVTIDPTLVYSVKRGYINHPDHRAAGQAALDAVFPLARDHLSFPELYAAGLEPHITPTVLLVNFESSNYYVDITANFERKLQALAAHDSQISDFAAAKDWLTKLAAENGGRAGCQYAESFVRLDLR